MKTYRKILGIILLSVLTVACDKNGNDNAGPKAGSGNSAAAKGGGSGSSGNTGKGEDYADLYVLHRDAQGVPVMGYKIVFDEEDGSYEGGVWYSEVLAYDNGVLIDDVYLEVNDDGELSEDNYYTAEEVDLGRINIVRSPQRVMDNALDEAISTIDGAELITTDASGRLVAVYGEIDWGTGEEDDKTIDSPRENMAIYQDLMKNGANGDLWDAIKGKIPGISENDIPMIAACAFAAGSDKTGTILTDEIIYVNNVIKASGDLTVFSSDDNSDMVTNANDELEELELDDDCTNFNNYDYFNNLKFYNFQSFSYSRQEVYTDKLVLIRVLNNDYTYSVSIKRVYDAVPFSISNTSQKSLTLTNMEGFTAACDDAVQVLEFIHGDSNIEYLGEHPGITDDGIEAMIADL